MSRKDCFLTDLSEELKPEFLQMAAEFRLVGEDKFESAEKDFEKYLEKLRTYAIGENLPVGHVRENTYFLMCGEKIIGRAGLRHYLTSQLAFRGGHIGYDIRPDERRKGYGTLILELTLEKARNLGLKRVLLTCDTDNIASSKIIEKNGGKLSKKLIYEENQTLFSQYWIEL